MDGDEEDMEIEDTSNLEVNFTDFNEGPNDL